MAAARAEDDAGPPPAPQEAWYTGPMLASSGGTLPKGHLLFEPYLFDVRAKGSDYLGSLTYLLYGATDRLTVGLIPTFGASHSDGATDARRIGGGDLTLDAQYRMHQAKIGELIPTWSLVVEEVLPTGRFDRLKTDTDRGIGSGAYATIFGLYAQRSDVLPSGRLLRTRINLTYTLPGRAKLRDVSVYGTPDGFDGHAHPGRSAFGDLSIEVSVSRSWVLASDLFYRRSAATRIDGTMAGGVLYDRRLDPQHSGGIAPAVEYSWSAARGVLFGLRRIFPNADQSGSWTPVFAFNAYF